MTTKINPYYTWPAILAAAMLVVITVNIYMFTLSTSGQSIFIEPQPYEKGMEYQQVIDELTAGKKSGFNPEIKLVKAEGNIYGISVNKADIGYLADSGTLRLIATFIRPNNRDMDKQVELLPQGGRYYSEVSLEPGLWDARYVLNTDQVKLRSNQPLRLP